MPVTRLYNSTAAPEAPAATPAAPSVPAGTVVGHGETRLLPRKKAWGVNQLLIPGAPPPRGETAGAHGAHKGRISVR